MGERANRPGQQDRVQRNGYAAQAGNRVQPSPTRGMPPSQANGRVQVRMDGNQSAAHVNHSGAAYGGAQASSSYQRQSASTGAPRTMASDARRGSNNAGAYGQGTIRQGSLQQGSARQGSAYQGTSRRGATRQGSSAQDPYRSYANSSHAGSSGGSKKKIGIIIGVVVAVALIAAAVVYFFVLRPSGGESAEVQQTQQTEAIVDAKTGYHSNKLDGATETVDANGIVHGTTPGGIKYTVVGRGETTSPSGAPGKIGLVAAGDVVSANWCLQICDRYAGEEGDGQYNYVPYYQEVAPFIQQYSLRYINQETTMDGPPYTGYPIFNSPDACADGMAQIGFNLVNLATNHAYDHEAAGVESTHAVFDRYPQIVTAGSYMMQDDRDTVHMIERDGVTFAFLGYTGCDNMYGIDPDNQYRPNDYYLCIFDKDKMKKEIANAKQVADVVIVSMHWGEEYTTELSDQQIEYAQFLVDQDVDLVIGSHAHILQPITMYTSATGKKIPVVFGLSDFISGWTLVETITSGMFTCEFTYDSHGVTLGNCAFYPCIEWSDGGDVYVRMLKDMSDEELAASTRNDNTDDIVGYVNGILDSIKFDVPVYR